MNIHLFLKNKNQGYSDALTKWGFWKKKFLKECYVRDNVHPAGCYLRINARGRKALYMKQERASPLY